ncbi:MAG: 1-deoxy-D-xylulose 5-phosphate reductoisomerase [Thiotrichales bacterium SG8_50]|nr:MAG: 1-deoxy-D-xylulose 5-phosphate reductoisomerase [Thiotrichales bacterium SG8_50]
MSSVPVQKIAVLGSTGSIGVSTLDVIARHPERFRIEVLTANTQVERLFEQCRQFQPTLAVMADEASATALKQKLEEAGLNTTVVAGIDALCASVSSGDVDVVMAAIVGAAGLKPTLAAVKAGKRVLIANKEPLVMAGDIFIAEARGSGALLLPIDSEHNAVLPSDFRTGNTPTGIRRVLLTCSGGPFRLRAAAELSSVTPDEACDHPNWSMGRKISVDSATLMNKGLELIEACWLFGIEPNKVEIVIHPQSVIHSMVEYLDGSVLAQLGNPDMRTPIAHALAWPERIDSGVDSLNLFDIARLDFESPDFERFPCLRLASEAFLAGGTAPAILNAANEVAVQAFLDEEIRFTQISEIIAATMAQCVPSDAIDLETILADDLRARDVATEIMQQPSTRVRGGLQ